MAANWVLLIPLPCCYIQDLGDTSNLNWLIRLISLNRFQRHKERRAGLSMTGHSVTMASDFLREALTLLTMLLKMNNHREASPAIKKTWLNIRGQHLSGLMIFSRTGAYGLFLA